jgi:PAS domain S-box-containing protein
MSKDRAERAALKNVAVYVAASLAWVASSDYALIWLVRDRAILSAVAVAVDAAFVIASAIVMYATLRRQFARREEAMSAIRELTRAHRMSAAVNAAIIRARSRAELFDAACRIVVEDGGYAMCWVGLAQHDEEKSVRLVASHTNDPRYAGFSEKARAVWSDTERGRGPTGTAIQTGRMAIVQSADAETALAPWKDLVQKLGFAALVSLPLTQGAETIGAITMYSTRPSPFDPSETDILLKMAAALGYALENLERAASEQARMAELRMFSQGVENSPDSIVITGNDVSIEYVNPSFVATMGYTLAELRGRKPWEVPLDVSPAADHLEMEKALSEGRTWQGELQSRAKDGRLFWESATVSPLRDASGRSTGHIAIKHDITARRMLVRASRMSAACDAAMIRARDRQELFDSICRIVVDEGGYLMSWVSLAADDAAKSVLPVARYGRDEGYVDGLRLTWADAERGRGPIGRAIREGKMQIARRMGEDPSLSTLHDEMAARGFVSSVAIPLKDGTRTIGALTMYTDRGDQFDQEEERLLEKLGATISYALGNLVRQEKMRTQVEQLRRLSHAVENSPASIIITDASGLIEYVNAKFTAVSGYTAAEAIGQNPRILKSGETPDEEYRKLWKTISSGQEWHGELHNRSKFGDGFWEWASISPIKDDAGKIVSYIAVKEDITHQRLLEQQLRQSQKMEAIGTLAGGVAHDFNNILTVIQGHCSLLESSKLPNDDARDSVVEIQQSADRAAALTRQLLAFSRRQPLRLKSVDLKESAERMGRMLRRLVPESVALETVTPDEPMLAMADTAMVDQVLMNLVLNARDAVVGSGSGRIRIEVAAADPAVATPEGRVAPQGWIRLQVTDDGCGIPMELLPRVFEPFFTTKPQGKGTGLGLAVVDGIARQHKGWVTVDSTVGRGTVFSVYLPRDAADETRPRGPAAAGAPRGAETILLAEDEASLRRLCVRSLEGLGYRLHEAPDGDAAAELWARREGKISLLITDMVMPGELSGELLAQRLRRDDPDLRVIFISGYHPQSESDSEPLPPHTLFLQKPFRSDELALAVRTLLDQD